MKKNIIVLFLVVFTMGLWAQSPQKMSYQAVIRNVEGVLVTNQSVGIRISILQGTPSGTLVFQETYNPNPKTNANGLVSIEVGSGLAITGKFSDINWSDGPYFLKTETDPIGATNYTIVGESQLLSVPYALYANTAESITGGITETDPIWISDSSDYYTKVNMQTSGSAQLHFGNITNKPATVAGYGITDAVTTTGNQTISGNKTFTGTITGTVNANNTVISNVATPVANQDAATKAYVDTLKSQLTSLENMLIESGGYRVADKDGKYYGVVKIGEQVWMSENLAYLPSVSPSNQGSPTTPFYYVYGYQGTNVSAAKENANYQTYGVLYNWTAALNACPVGWHLPSDAEWTTLENYLIANKYNYDDTKVDNKIAKALAAKINWILSSNVGSVGNTDYESKRNLTDFGALPGGGRSYDGNFWVLTVHGYWWSSSEYSTLNAWNRSLFYDAYDLKRNNPLKEDSFSVRCIKD